MKETLEFELKLANITRPKVHCKKKVSDFPVPSRDVTNQPGLIKLFPSRESLVSDIPAWDGKMASLFYSVGHQIFLYSG